MNLPSAFSCQCVDCPRPGCLCGCGADAAPSAAQSAGQACACGERCVCGAAQQGCRCSPPQS